MTLLQTDERSLDAPSCDQDQITRIYDPFYRGLLSQHSYDSLCSSHITAITSKAKPDCLAGQGKLGQRVGTSSQIELTSPMS